MEHDQSKKRILPRIHSQKRVHTAFQRKQTNNDTIDNKTTTNRALSGMGNNCTLRRTLSSAKTSKVVHYENSTLIISKKTQQLETQLYLLNRDIKTLQQQIKILRNDQSNKKRKDEYLGAEKDKQSILSNSGSLGTTYRKNINVNDVKSLKNQIRIAQNRIDAMRKKIDKENNKNKGLQKQVDGFRKQIATTKTLMFTLQNKVSITNQKFDELKNISRQLDELIAEKNNFLHRKKVETLHDKAKMIKQYDNILKTLDKQLKQEKQGENVSIDHNQKANHFYMTEIGMKYNKNEITSPTTKKKSYQFSIAPIKQKLKNYEYQFDILKEHTGKSNADQITTQFLNKYEENFEHYKYIQELYMNINQLHLENQQLRNRKQQLRETIIAKNSKQKDIEIENMKTRLQAIKQQKQKCKKDIQQFDVVYSDLKSTVKQFFDKIKCEDRFSNQLKQQLNENTLLEALNIIQDRKLQLQALSEQQQNNYFSTNQGNLQEFIELTKNESNRQIKNQKLLTREDFLKNKQTLLKKYKKDKSSTINIKR